MRNYIADAIKYPDKILTNLGRRGFLNWMSDECYLKILYRLVLKKKLNLKNPITFNEKLQWLKLHDRNPEYTKMVDKCEVKKYVASIIGEEYIIPTLGVYEKFDDIDFNKLPNQFVIKCTHDSGGIVICRDKKHFDITKAKKKINRNMKQNFFYFGREWPYKNVQPRIIVEQYLSDKQEDILSRKIDIQQVNFAYFKEYIKNVYHDDYDSIKEMIENTFHQNFEFNQQQSLTIMKNFVSILEKDFSKINSNFYSIDEKIYFGELTLYLKDDFYPEKFCNEFDSWVKLPRGGYIYTKKNIIILVKILYDQSDLKDYKIFCFNGKAEIILVCSERFLSNNMCETFFDRQWNILPIVENNHRVDKSIEKPKKLEKMLDLAEKLSKDISFIRVDFYEVNNRILFGELTFFPNTGLERFEPVEYDQLFGEWIHIDIK